MTQMTFTYTKLLASQCFRIDTEMTELLLTALFDTEVDDIHCDFNFS